MRHDGYIQNRPLHAIILGLTEDRETRNSSPFHSQRPGAAQKTKGGSAVEKRLFAYGSDFIWTTL